MPELRNEGMLEEWRDNEEEEDSGRRAKEEDELRWDIKEAFFEDDARNTEAEAAEYDECIARVQVETAIDVPEKDDSDPTEHEDSRCEVSPPEALVEESDGEENSEECFCFSDELGIHRFRGPESHIQESEACDDKSAKEKEGEGRAPLEGKKLPKHWEESIGEEDKDDDGNLSDKEHGKWREDGGELPSEDGEC